MSRFFDSNSQKSEEELYHEAEFLEEKGDLEGALDCYGLILQKYPVMADFFVNKGRVLTKIGRFDEAFNCYEKALSLADINKEIILGAMGTWAAVQRRFELAVAYFRKAINENPHYAMAWSNLIKTLIQCGKKDEAKEACSNFMLACTMEDKALYDEARYLVNRFCN
jgi:tetratricopeptide (TPR) repeat protein